MSGDWTPSLDAVARRLAAEPRLELWFDVSPLFDEQWTGIPVVAAALARRLLIHLPQTRFFFETTEIKPDFVRDALVRDSGVLLPASSTRHGLRSGSTPRSSGCAACSTSSAT